MGRIADEIIREVRDRVDIVELVSRHLALKKSGRNYVGLCPFHSEKTGSFNVSPEKQGYYCFGCHEGGNAFSFLMKIENLSFPEAVRTLARECGVEIPETSASEPGHTERLYRANEIAHAHYRKLLAAPGNPARAYLAARGLDSAAIEKFELGYAPNAWDSLAHALRAQKLAPDICVQAGLVVERDSGGHYDRLRDRVTFPIRDVRGRVIGFGARAISAGQEPKYLNTPESPIFRKREAFYGYPDALAPMRADARAVVVEGYFDRIALARAGVGGAVATCGTALTPEHVRDLRRRTREVVLLFDADDAGQRALDKALALLLPEGLRVRAVALPAGDDPDSFAAREGSDALRARVEAAVPAIEAVIQRVAARGNESVAAAGRHDDVWKIADAVAEVVPLLAAIPSAVERGEFARQLALAVGAQPRDVEEAIAVQRRGGDPREAVRAQPRRSGPQDRILEQLVRSLIEHPGLLERIAADELLALLPAGRPAEIVRALAAGPRAERLDLDALCERVGDDTKALLRELATSSAELDAETATRILDDTIRWLRKRLRGEQSRALTRRLRDADPDWRSVLEAKQQLRGRLEAPVQRRPELAS